MSTTIICMTENTFGRITISEEILEAVYSVFGNEYKNFRFSRISTDEPAGKPCLALESPEDEGIQYRISISEDDTLIRKINLDTRGFNEVRVNTESPDMDAVDECLNTPVEA